ncbi:hypothetical protein [Paenibacillus apiarius]|uniref:Uncharacterized protein n=1 Tax=Paenibacillus apiarius TaxID=46240 RepID=A0ABT4DVH3_9BACL|nr:hypothetical protein [Paenibacillus apiarius]MCY9513291.1 hypothetical protein [Paenibacillus apiarius]MCY9521350.1 hypothetical protein [Paenibacillus apiarius]MCY9555577.1 hypothetical protein [Paenibacillus apiarius]MCY9560707.1 hypothetical protein [Paenibacillus apiarius]MCY9685042.1 hypothetical protein [Paenibacillus apiarius]
MSNGTIIKMPKYPCQFCKKREATQLCDFVVSYGWTSAKDEEGRMIGGYWGTCDNEMCKECANKLSGGFEFCPSCLELHKYVMKHHDRRAKPIRAAIAFGRYGDD